MKDKPRAPALAATVGLADDGSLGKVLVDPRGRTLYLFQKDSGTAGQRPSTGY